MTIDENKTPAETPQPSRSGDLTPPEQRAGAKPVDLNLILDIPLEVSVEVGRTEMLIDDLLQLSQGSVIELDKAAGETFDVLVNGKLVARGEVVVVNERLGIRLTEVISPTERIQSLR